MWSLSLTASTQACASASAGNAMAPVKFALQCTQIGAKEYIKMHENYSEEIQMHHSNTSKYISNCSLGISDQQVLEQNANNSFQMRGARTRGVQVGEFIVVVWWKVRMKGKRT